MTVRTCPRCERRTSAPDCCGIILAARRRWRMTNELVRRVHVVARGRKGLDDEAYRMRLRAVGAESSKQLSREQFRELMRGLATLPDVQRKVPKVAA